MSKHWFVVWHNALPWAPSLVQMVEQKFQVLDKTMHNWDDWPSTLNAFYKQDLSRHNKLSHIGADRFLVLDVEDSEPVWGSHKGLRANLNVVSLKTAMREATGGGHRVHASINEDEYVEQMEFLCLNN